MDGLDGGKPQKRAQRAELGDQARGRRKMTEGDQNRECGNREKKKRNGGNRLCEVMTFFFFFSYFLIPCFLFFFVDERSCEIWRLVYQVGGQHMLRRRSAIEQAVSII